MSTKRSHTSRKRAKKAATEREIAIKLEALEAENARSRKALENIYAMPRPEPDPRILAALESIDRALIHTMAGTVDRAGAGPDAHNLAVAMKASTDLRSLLQIAEVL